MKHAWVEFVLLKQLSKILFNGRSVLLRSNHTDGPVSLGVIICEIDNIYFQVTY